jgi:hypothetical protein
MSMLLSRRFVKTRPKQRCRCDGHAGLQRRGRSDDVDVTVTPVCKDEVEATRSMRGIDEVDGTATLVQKRLCATSTMTVADVDRSGAWDRTTDLEV